MPLVPQLFAIRVVGSCTIDGAQVVPALEATEVTQSNGSVIVWRAVEKSELEMDRLELIKATGDQKRRETGSAKL